MCLVGNWAASPQFSRLRPKQNGLHLADDIFKCVFLKKTLCINFEFTDICKVLQVLTLLVSIVRKVIFDKIMKRDIIWYGMFYQLCRHGAAMLLKITRLMPNERPMTRSFDVFFYLRLSKQSWDWWFDMPSRSLWRHYNGSRQEQEGPDWWYLNIFFINAQSKYFIDTELVYLQRRYRWYITVTS